MKTFVALLGVVGCHASEPRAPDALASDALAIDAARLEATTKYLASDALEGRAPGSRGGALAETYVAEQMAAIGLVPAGEHGTWFQTVPLRAALRDEAHCSLVVHGRDGDATFAGAELVFRSDVHAAEIAIDAPLVFAGFGISQPELGWDDLAGVDLHGAIAVVLGGAPHAIGGRPVPPTLRAVLSDAAARTRVLRDRGAVAMVVMYAPDREALRPWDRVVDNSKFENMAWLDGAAVGSDPVLPLVLVHEPAFDLMLAAAGVATHADSLWERADAGTPQVAHLVGTGSLRIRSTLRELSARNVAGMIRGQTDEIVVVTAHLDHLGVGEPVNGDAIYNGALDDAIGVAGILEIARVIAARPQPRRSIVFLATTAEEKGLLGSDYFVHHPTVAIDRVVADINIDGLTAQWEPLDIIPIGAEHSSLGRDVDRAARAAGLDVSADAEPDQVYFIRSDQYSFVRAGVPSVFPGAGYRDASGGTARNRGLSNAWGAAHYHRPSDEWRPGYRGAWAAKEARFDALLALAVANAPERPRWNPGDELAPGHRLPW